MSKGKGGRLQLLTSLFGADGLNSRNARLVDDYLKTAGVSPRTAFVAEQVATNRNVQAALDAADAAGMGGEYKVLAEVAGGFDAMPPPRAAAEAPRDPSFEQRLATDPAIQARIGEISPGFQSRMGRGEVTADEVMEVLGFGPLNPKPTPPLPDGMPRMPAPDTPSPLGERVARQRDLAGRLGSDAPPPQYTPPDPTSQAFVQGPAGYSHRVGVRPSQSGIGAGRMDDAEAAAALLAPPPPRDLGTSLADTGALGPMVRDVFGVPGFARSRQVGTQGGGRLLGDVSGPSADLSVQVAGPGGMRSDVLPGSGVVGDMPVGRAGDVMGPGALDVDVVTPAGRATIDDAVGPAGTWEGRVNRRGSQVTGEEVVAGPMDIPPAAVDAVDVPAPGPRQAPALTGTDIPDTRMATAEELFEARNAAARAQRAAARAADVTVMTPEQRVRARNILLGQAGAGTAAALGLYALQPGDELDDPPPLDVASPDELVDDAVKAAVEDLVLENDLDVPEVEFDPIQLLGPGEPAAQQAALPPAEEMFEDVPEAMQPMVGEPVGIPRSDVPAYRRLMEIRELLQRGGDEEQIRNNPRYADLDDYQRERAILRGRDLGNRRDRVRMAGILSQGGRLPYGPAAAAGDRFLRMDPQEQQDFLAAGGFNPMARGPMQDMAARQQHRRRMEEVAALGQNQVNVANAQGEWGVRGAQVGADAQLGVAGINRQVAERGQDANERIATADRAVKFQDLERQLATTNATLQQAAREGNANRAAAARTEVARINARMRELAAAERQTTETNQSRERVARMGNPEPLDPLDAVDRSATALAIPKLNEIVGRERSRGASRAQARAAIKRDSVAALASEQEIARVLDRVYPK
jgi:hypothetical protein